MQNRLSHTISISSGSPVKPQQLDLESKMLTLPTESAVLAKTQVLQETGAAMLAQANAAPQLVLGTN